MERSKYMALIWILIHFCSRFCDCSAKLGSHPPLKRIYLQKLTGGILRRHVENSALTQRYFRQTGQFNNGKYAPYKTVIIGKKPKGQDDKPDFTEEVLEDGANHITEHFIEKPYKNTVGEITKEKDGTLERNFNKAGMRTRSHLTEKLKPNGNYASYKNTIGEMNLKGVKSHEHFKKETRMKDPMLHYKTQVIKEIIFQYPFSSSRTQVTITSSNRQIPIIPFKRQIPMGMGPFGTGPYNNNVIPATGHLDIFPGFHYGSHMQDTESGFIPHRFRGPYVTPVMPQQQQPFKRVIPLDIGPLGTGACGNLNPLSHMEPAQIQELNNWRRKHSHYSEYPHQNIFKRVIPYGVGPIGTGPYNTVQVDHTCFHPPRISCAGCQHTHGCCHGPGHGFQYPYGTTWINTNHGFVQTCCHLPPPVCPCCPPPKKPPPPPPPIKCKPRKPYKTCTDPCGALHVFLDDRKECEKECEKEKEETDKESNEHLCFN